jgi:hypothetical protein
MVAAHSTQEGGSRPTVWLAAILLVASPAATPAIAAASTPAAPGAAVQSSAYWVQIEGRIESSYFQQNAAGLQALAATLAVGDPPAGDTRDAEWRSYYGALAAYRLALLASSDPTRAWSFAQQCIDRLDRALALDPGSAEALALQSACLALQSNMDPWRSPFAAPLSLSRIDKALKLAPGNPRVLLLGAMAARDRPKFFGGDSQQAFALMQRAVSAFERQSAQPRGLPGWGAADAFTELARDYLGRGDTLAARNVLERALLLAPHYAQARRLMDEIVAG